MDEVDNIENRENVVEIFVDIAVDGGPLINTFCCSFLRLVVSFSILQSSSDSHLARLTHGICRKPPGLFRHSQPILHIGQDFLSQSFRCCSSLQASFGG